jgi:hypothetical protein
VTPRSVLASVLASAAVGLCLMSAPAQVASSSIPAGTQRESADDAVESVLAISIDGLNPEALRILGRTGAPHLHAFMASGASTLNARTARERTITLPNHTGMVTGRRVAAAAGGHGVTWNDDRRRPATVQAAAGERVESVFTSISGAGGSTALFASKTKFSLWNRSWPLAIDKTRIQLDNGSLARAVRRDLRGRDREFRFVHFSLPDSTGHAKGFMSRPYLRSVRQVDALLGSIVTTVESDPALDAGTAIIVTSDHGGLGVSHSDARRFANYRVVFMVAGPGVAVGGDLYALNPDDRLDPGTRRTSYGQSVQPVRNSEVANLTLDLLDLDPVPGSQHNSELGLDVSLPR